MTASRTSRRTTAQRRTYVLDTSVLLSDPWAVSRFAEHAVVLPLVVIGELEGKRHHPELGWFARESLRLLDDLRLAHGRLDKPIPIGTAGGTLHVELNHSDPEVLPPGFRAESNDARILACALNLAAHIPAVVLVTKDIPLRVKAGAVGLEADEYRAQEVTPSGWTGMADVDVSQDVIDALFAQNIADLADYGIELPADSDAYNSVGGFVFSQLGRLPKRGDMVRANGYSLRVESVRENRIEAVRIRERRAVT